MLLDDIFLENDTNFGIKKHLGLPIQVWKKEYDNGKAGTEKLIEEVVLPLSNYLSKTAFGGGLFAGTENSLLNFERYDGKFDNLEEDYASAFLYGNFNSEDEEKLRDFNYYWYVINRIEAELLKNDIQFSVNVINREAGLKKKQKNSEMGAEAMVRSVIDNVKQTTNTDEQTQDGVDLGFAKDKEIFVPNRMEELNKFLNDKEISSQQIYILLQHHKEKYNLKREINSKNVTDKAKVNACFGIFDINNENDPVYSRVDPRNITWVGPSEIGAKGFDDCCDAVQITEFVPASQALIKDRGLFDTNLSTAKKITEYISKLDSSDINNMKSAMFETTSMDKWGTFWSMRPGTGLHVCRQHQFFKMIHPKRYKVLFKNRNITIEEYKDFKNYRKNFNDITFKSVADDYNGTDEEIIIIIPVVKLHEALIYGSDHVLMVRQYPIQMQSGYDFGDVKYPLTACKWKDKSIVSIGKDLGHLYHVAMKKLVEETKQMSVSDMINFDVNTLPDGYTYEHIPYMLKEKINIYDGSRITAGPNNKEASRHLTSSKISVSPNEIIALFNFAMIISNTYYRMLGYPMEQNFMQKNETQNRNQGTPHQSSMAMLPFFDEFIEEYTNQVFQKQADIGRYTWSRDETKQVILGKGETKLIKMDKDVPIDEQGIFVVNDYKSAMDKKFLLDAAVQGLSSGQVSFGEVIKIYNSENPEQIQALFSEGLSVMEKLQQKQQESQQAATDKKLATDEAKLQIPIMVQKEITQRMLDLQDKVDNNKDQREAAKIENKGETTDVQYQQKLEMQRQKANLDAGTKAKDKSEDYVLSEAAKQADHAREKDLLHHKGMIDKDIEKEKAKNKPKPTKKK